MEPDQKRELLRTTQVRVRERLETGSVRASDLAAEIIQDFPEIWNSVRDRLALERLTAIVLYAIERHAKPRDERQLTFGFDHVPRVVSIGKTWTPFERLTLPEWNVIVKRYEARTRKSTLARLKERTARLREMRRIRRMLAFFYPTDHGISIGPALERREEFEEAIAAWKKKARAKQKAAKKKA